MGDCHQFLLLQTIQKNRLVEKKSVGCPLFSGLLARQPCRTNDKGSQETCVLEFVHPRGVARQRDAGLFASPALREFRTAGLSLKLQDFNLLSDTKMLTDGLQDRECVRSSI